MSLTRIMLLSVLLMVMTGCQPSSAIPRLNNAMLWKRLGLNRAIGGDRPQITSSKKKGESTVYYIKLPPQPHYYIPLNLLPSSGSGYQKNTPEPFETVSVDFTANGKPENVYHWNLPLGVTMPTTVKTTTDGPLLSSSTTTMPTTTTPTTTTQPPSSTRAPFNNKKPYRHSYYNNGKPHKLYFVKPTYGVPSTPNSTPTSTSTTSSATEPAAATAAASSTVRTINKKLQFKKNFYGNGKPNQLYFVQPSHYSSHSV